MTVNVFGRRLPATATYVAALALALLLLLVTVGTALWQANRSVSLNQEVRQALEVRSSLRLLMRAMQDAETGQRGYLLTGDETYLAPYSAARDDVARELANLERATAYDGVRLADVERLSEIAQAKLDELAGTVALRQSGRGGEALRLVRSGAGKALMDEFRGILNRLEADQEQRVHVATAAVDRAAERMQIVVVLAGLLLLGLGGLLLVTVRNAMAELRASRDEARGAHERALQEMSARESAESKVRQMQKMEAIGQLTGGVAHDFNNMLAVIIGALQMAQRRLARGEHEIDRFIDAAMDGARRAATLTSRLLAFARRQPLQPQVLDVNRIVSGMSEMLRRTLGENIEMEAVLGGGILAGQRRSQRT